ncbi:MAG: hypothetical protein SFV52_07740 [Saprospiraceae bacterium]|nr:hypothetical protein [Saprospiraceae bacterium]
MANQVLFGSEGVKQVVAATVGTIAAVKIAVVALPVIAVAGAAYAINEHRKKNGKKKK